MTTKLKSNLRVGPGNISLIFSTTSSTGIFSGNMFYILLADWIMVLSGLSE